MRNRIRYGLVAGVAAAALVVPATAAPAATTGPDCVIMGPEYVSEVVDCGRYLIMILIGG